jgi:hypothetical protein
MGVRVSFVVIAYNEAKNIGRTLSAIGALAGLADYEVVVVNDGSGDATADVVREHAAGNPNVRLIDLPRNRGRGHARATGIAAAEGELIATVDADIILPGDWLRRAESALGGHDAVGGTAVPDGDVAYVYQATGLSPRIVGHTTAVTGSNALYRRRVFDVVSFDPALREGEDVALNQATSRQGLSFTTVPGLLVEHIEKKSFPASLRWLFTTGKGATRQLFVYRQIRVPDLAAGAFLASLAAGVAIAVVVNPFGIALPVLVLTVIAGQHVRSRFETPRGRWRSVTAAVAIDGALLLAYFTGRVAGVGWLLGRRPGRPGDGTARTGSDGRARDASPASAAK